MKLKVSRIQDEALRIKSFELRPMNGDELPVAAAGSHIGVEISLDGGTDYRQFSVLSSQSDRPRYEIAVLLEKNGSGGSRFMHENVREGQVLEVLAPRNEFPLAEGGRHTVLIAGGIGITPILAMLRQLASEDASVEVHYAARSRANMAYREEVLRLAGSRAFLYVSDEPSSPRLDLRALLSPGAAAADSHVYVCGPRRLIRDVRRVTAEGGWRPEQIHFESFGSRLGPDEREIEVELAYSGFTVAVGPDQTVLEAVLDAGVWAPSDCRRGECGMCVTQVLEGEPDHRDVYLTDAERHQSMRTCVSRAEGPRLGLAL